MKTSVRYRERESAIRHHVEKGTRMMIALTLSRLVPFAIVSMALLTTPLPISAREQIPVTTLTDRHSDTGGVAAQTVAHPYRYGARRGRFYRPRRSGFSFSFGIGSRYRSFYGPRSYGFSYYGRRGFPRYYGSGYGSPRYYGSFSYRPRYFGYSYYQPRYFGYSSAVPHYYGYSDYSDAYPPYVPSYHHLSRTWYYGSYGYGSAYCD